MYIHILNFIAKEITYAVFFQPCSQRASLEMGEASAPSQRRLEMNAWDEASCPYAARYCVPWTLVMDWTWHV